MRSASEVGSHTAVARRSWSSPLLKPPCTRSIRDKVGHGGRQATDRAERLAGVAVIVVEPTMTIFLERCAIQPLYHQRGKSQLSWRRRRNFIDSFITKTAKGVPVSLCGCCRGHVRPAVLPWPRSFPTGMRRPVEGFLLTYLQARGASGESLEAQFLFRPSLPLQALKRSCLSRVSPRGGLVLSRFV